MSDSRGATPRPTAGARTRGGAFRTRTMSSHDQDWTADHSANAPGNPTGGQSLPPGELDTLRALLRRLARVERREELLDVIASSVEALIGATAFAVLERSGRVATLLWARGDEALLRRAASHPRVRDTLRYGASHYAASPHAASPHAASHYAARPQAARPEADGAVSSLVAEPVASIPLWGMGGNVCGALVLAGLLPTRGALGARERRVLTLLASEAGRLLCTLPPGARMAGVA